MGGGTWQIFGNTSCTCVCSKWKQQLFLERNYRSRERKKLILFDCNDGPVGSSCCWSSTSWDVSLYIEDSRFEIHHQLHILSYPLHFSTPYKPKKKQKNDRTIKVEIQNFYQFLAPPYEKRFVGSRMHRSYTSWSLAFFTLTRRRWTMVCNYDWWPLNISDQPDNNKKTYVLTPFHWRMI